jgi:uncharacterized protein (UPF0261 family)|tara:strand:- start:398 stop:1633 length:1236 start_codon:yes stop_codon:yes gene_type:complete
MLLGEVYTFPMPAHPHFLVLATCDTKGEEGAWIRARIQALGATGRLVDVGICGPAKGKPDISAEEVCPQVKSFSSLSRGEGVDQMADSVATWIQSHQEGLLGVIAIGGSAGTTIGCQAMRALPNAIPKVMISTLASGDVSPFVQGQEISMLDPLVDVAGINRISRQAFDEGIAELFSLAKMSASFPDSEYLDEKPLVAASMFGVTTPCVDEARRIIEKEGYEMLVFHATGAGGRNMEKFIRQGHIVGVLDFTTTEVADEIVGGVLSAGSSRLTAAGNCGVPQVVSAGATDMVNFWEQDTIPSSFSDRHFHSHNAHVTLMRTTVEESQAIGEVIGERLSHSPLTTQCLFPLKGVSALDCDGGDFDDSAARQALFSSWKINAGKTHCEELDLHINDPAFAQAAVDSLLKLLRK